ncbi:MAG: CHRD domain-containing protein [Verrucomicrobiae bacterium]|nr:CHRD domain-containing protein [Verrucomicrobiae bacterium]
MTNLSDLKWHLAILSVIPLFGISTPACAGVISLNSRLDGAQANAGAGTGSPGTGYGRITFDDVSRVLTWEINWEGLQGTVTNMHFHGPAAPGVNGGVAVAIADQETPSIGTATLTEAQAADLLNGLIYINIHTSVQGGGEIRGQVLVPDLLVSLDATALDEGPLETWTNNGSLPGDFDIEFDTPEVATVDGVKAVVFDGSGDWYVGPETPASVTGASSRTVVAWVNNEEIADEETVFAWGRRGGPDATNTSFNHGANATFGALGHWGGSDIGWNGTQVAGEWTMIAYTWDADTQTTNVYTDGLFANREENIALNTHAVDNLDTPLPFVVGNQNEADGTHTDALSATMAIARIRTYAGVLAPEQIESDFIAEAPDFGFAFPIIGQFSATPVNFAAGDTVTLTWQTLGADSVTIDNDIGDVSGMTSVEVTPTSTTTYTLTAKSGDSTNTAEVTVSQVSLATLAHRWSFSEAGGAGTELIDAVGGKNGVIIDGGANDATVDDGAVTMTGGDRTASDYVELPAGLISAKSSLSIETWATQHSIQNWSRVFSIGSATTNVMHMSWTRGTDGNTNEYRWNLETAAVPGNLTIQDFGGTPTNPIDEEVHWVVTIDDAGGANGDTLVTIYKDGEQVGQGETTNDTSMLVDTNIWLGRSQWGDAAPNASYNEFRIWDGAMTASQVAKNNADGPDAEFPVLINRWSFNETGGSGTELIDSIGGMHGTIVENGNNDGVVGGGRVTLAGGGRDSSDYVELPAGLISGNPSLSIETWATQHSIQNWSRVMSFGSATDDVFHMAWTRGTAGDQNEFRWNLAGVGGDDLTLQDFGGPPPNPIDEEVHWVITFDDEGGENGDTLVTIYRNGEEVAQGETFSDTSMLVDTNAWLGRSQWGDNAANASWNEFRIYSGVLSSADVAANFLKGPDNDSDGDGLPNSFEEAFAFLDPNNAADAALDQDNDGLSNLAEFELGTDLEKPDTDGDGLKDGEEVAVAIGSNPANADTDGDGLTDGDEVNQYGTSPVLADSDADHISDGLEIEFGSNPNDPASIPSATYPNLIHRWSFEETGGEGTELTDSIGTAHGTIIDGGVSDGAVGGGQVTLAGGIKDDSDYVEFPSDLLEGLTSVTIETWATEHSVQNWSRVFSFGAGDGDTTDAFHLAWSRGGDQNTQRLEKQGPGPADSNLPVELNREYHIVAVWDGEGGETGDGQYRWYRDGELAASLDSAGVGLDTVNDTVLWLGRSQWADNTANASWNELRIYEGALSPVAVAVNTVLGPDNAPGVSAGNQFQIIDFQLSDTGAVTLTWTSREGGKYGVQRSDTLLEAGWEEVTDDEPSQGATTSFTDAGLPAGTTFKYYRVIETP